MYSLKHLREHILQTTGLDPANVSVLTEHGTVKNHYERDNEPSTNKFFAVEYTATLIIVNCTDAPEYILYQVGQWLHKNQPSHAPDAIKLEAEILDHDTVDLKIDIKGIKDTYKPVVKSNGTLIIQTPNAPADPILSDSVKKLELVHSP